MTRNDFITALVRRIVAECPENAELSGVDGIGLDMLTMFGEIAEDPALELDPSHPAVVDKAATIAERTMLDCIRETIGPAGYVKTAATIDTLASGAFDAIDAEVEHQRQTEDAEDLSEDYPGQRIPE